MSKVFKIIVLTSDSHSLIGAFTSLAGLKPFEDRINKAYAERGWDIIEVSDYKQEWIMHDYCLDDFDIILHD